jgi:hypothetical protein
MMKPTGSITEGIVLSALLRQGKTVLVPFGYNTRYDLLVDEGNGKFTKIQCKTGRLTKDKSCIMFDACSSNWKGTKKNYIGEVDYFGVAYSGKVYLFPVGTHTSRVQLRLTPPKKLDNNVVINWAKDYEI